MNRCFVLSVLLLHPARPIFSPAGDGCPMWLRHRRRESVDVGGAGGWCEASSFPQVSHSRHSGVDPEIPLK